MVNLDTIDTAVSEKMVDTRRSSQELNRIFSTRLSANRWSPQTICLQDQYPIHSFVSSRASSTTNTPTFWVLGGVHGEEPAPSEAFANEIDSIAKLGDSIPMVFLPLLNPLARDKDWRYENEYRDHHIGKSVTDSEHLLLGSDGHPRTARPTSDTAAAITSWILKQVKLTPPLLVIDHHEDRVTNQYPEGDPRNLESCYVYVSGKGSAKLPIAHQVIDCFTTSGLPVANSGHTRFHEPIVDEGIVINTADGSVDEFFTASEYFNPETNQVETKKPADTVIVAETTIPFNNPISLETRVKAHQAITHTYPTLWQKAIEISSHSS